MGDSSGIRLTEWTSCGGCAAKWGAAVLAEMVAELPRSADTALLVGLSPFDDAAVYLLGDELALVATTDFFPPLVDGADDFGSIAAANACSDVFAMGADVKIALDVAGFPETMPREVIATVFNAAAKVVAEAGGTVAGGHTIRSPEPIFGLAVIGTVHPDRVWRKSGARPGDVLVLSKPLGTGIALAGGDDDVKAEVITGMRSLNLGAAETLKGLNVGPNAVTDVTGYGLAGHGWEMSQRSGFAITFNLTETPSYPGVRELALGGIRTGGDARNREYLAGHVNSNLPIEVESLAYDPQTSGGLLAAVDPSVVEGLLERDFFVVGEVLDSPAGVRLVG